MKMKQILTLACALLGGAASSYAADPVRDLADLGKLEAKVEAVSAKVLPATVEGAGEG